MEQKKEITIEEVLAPYKGKNEAFYYAYLDCNPIDWVEGMVFENATYSGYALKAQNGYRFFTPYGIRGISKGTFFIYHGEPIEIQKEIDLGQLDIINKILEQRVSRKIHENWYKVQIEKYEGAEFKGLY